MATLAAMHTLHSKSGRGLLGKEGWVCGLHVKDGDEKLRRAGLRTVMCGCGVGGTAGESLAAPITSTGGSGTGLK